MIELKAENWRKVRSATKRIANKSAAIVHAYNKRNNEGVLTSKTIRLHARYMTRRDWLAGRYSE